MTTVRCLLGFAVGFTTTLLSFGGTGPLQYDPIDEASVRGIVWTRAQHSIRGEFAECEGDPNAYSEVDLSGDFGLSYSGIAVGAGYIGPVTLGQECSSGSYSADAFAATTEVDLSAAIIASNSTILVLVREKFAGGVFLDTDDVPPTLVFASVLQLGHGNNDDGEPIRIQVPVSVSEGTKINVRRAEIVGTVGCVGTSGCYCGSGSYSGCTLTAPGISVGGECDGCGDPSYSVTLGASDPNVPANPDASIQLRYMPQSEATIFCSDECIDHTASIAVDITAILMAEYYTDVLCEGDFDGDNDIDAADLSSLLELFGFEFGDSNYDPDFDLDGDLTIGAGDLSVLLENYGTSCE